jgi:RNA polymerase sigma factor (sigma-70 family)
MDFVGLLKRISPKLRGITYRLNGRHCFFNDEDLYQEALVHLWESFRRGVLGDKTDSYILQGCYFYLKNYMRKNFEKGCLVSLESENQDEGGVALRDVIAGDFNKSGYLDYLHDKLLAEVIQNNGLLQREKEILRLYAQGLATREIGERLGVSHVSVVKATRRIRQKCLRYLDKL